MRELRVEDALLYLDQVKMEFGDRPHIYNEFLDIMKTFKTQELDTPGVIRRVSTLFQGNHKLVLGFNTFLPEGYKIELPRDGPPVAVYRAPGQTEVTHILGPAASATSQPGMPGTATGPPHAQPPAGSQPQMMGQQQQAPRGGAMMGQPHRQQQQGQLAQSQQGGMAMDQRQHSDSYQQMHPQQHQMQQPRPQPPQMMDSHMQQIEPRSNVQQHAPRQQHPQGGMPPSAGGPPPHGPPPQMQQPLQALAPVQPQAQQQGAQAPVEFDHAINYVTTIKKRFAAEPDIYKKFLEILHTYQKEQRGIKEVLDEVSVLFADHPDLLKEFTYFLPDAVQAQAKAQLDAVAKESEARLRAKSSKQAIMQTAQGMQRQAHGLRQGALPGGVIPRAGAPIYSPAPIPFGATQGRSDDREREICRSSVYGSVVFAPVRPPRRNEMTVAQAAMKKGRPFMIPDLPVQPTTAESAFFERAKLHLNRRELAPDKPPGSKRHTPYTEFLKCLHLFGAGVLNKEELILLLRGLFMQGHAPKSGANAGGGASNPAVASDAHELLREFEEVLFGRGPYAEQEKELKDKSKYGATSRRDFDFSHSEHPTPSYFLLPSDYPKSLFYSHSGQTEEDAAVLNEKFLCVVPLPSKKRHLISPEQYDGVKARRNVNEEAMFKVEDERFEADMTIERNLMAMRQVEPMAEEVTRLREIEEKEGQPIGRMTYTLRSRSLNCSQIHAIARLYGEKGDEVIQHLMRNPVSVLPIVYRRLRQKDIEWRRLRSEMSKEWNGVNEANYEGSLDVMCSSYKKELEHVVSPEQVMKDVKETRQLIKHPKKKEHPASLDWSYPEYFLSCPLQDEVLYQPHVRVPMHTDGFPHKDVYQLVSRRTLKGMFKSDPERERVARIWAEFMSPWFDYPSNWIAAELRDSYKGDESSCTVKYSPGQKVQTCYGDGEIISRIAPSNDIGLRYMVNLSYGAGYLRPSAIVHSLPATGHAQNMIRQNGVMEKTSLHEESEGVNKRRLHMFGTERIYTLMRIYSYLVYVLSNTKTFLLSQEGQLKETQTTTGIGFSFEKSESNDKIIARHDYAGLISVLKKLIADDIDIQAYESFCRKTAKDRVYQLIALPRLIDRCAEAMVKVAKEDKALSLFDLAQLKIMDPERLRVLSHSESTDASYRIQFDPVGKYEYFCYLAPGEHVLTAPDDEADDEMEEDDEVMADEEIEHGDIETEERVSKRQKVEGRQ